MNFRKTLLLIMAFLIVVPVAARAAEKGDDAPAIPMQSFILTKRMKYHFNGTYGKIVGMGVAQLDNRTIFVGGKPGIGAVVAASFVTITDPMFLECAKIMEAYLPAGKKLSIAGFGTYRTAEDNGLVTQVIFEITQLTQCNLE